MITIRTDITYPKFERNTAADGSRVYFPPDSKPVPSVTTILSATKDTTKLDEWRVKVGNEEADRILKESIEIGSHLHNNLENYILNNGKPRTGPLIAKLMTDIIAKNGLKNVSEVWGIEAPLYMKDLYAGTTDLVGVHNGTLSIIDFKNSKKKKKEEWIEDYYLQATAYIKAHNNMFNSNINKAVIMMVTRECKYLEFTLGEDRISEYMSKWDKRVEEYYTKFGHLHN